MAVHQTSDMEDPSHGTASSPEMQAHSRYTWPVFFPGISPWLAGIWQIFVSWVWLVTTLRPLSERKLHWPPRYTMKINPHKELFSKIYEWWKPMLSDLWTWISNLISRFRSREEAEEVIAYLHASMLGHFSHVLLFATPWTVACQAPLSTGSPGKNTGVGCHALLQGIFPTQGSNPPRLCLLHWQADSLPLALAWPGKPNCLLKYHYIFSFGII